MSTNDELLAAATENTGAAQAGLTTIHTVGRQQPVPPQLFTQVMVHLRNAQSAIIELERRARGGAPVKEG